MGAAVGMTGVGGGTLMTPILVLLFRTAPAMAVGTDLWFAAVTKLVGVAAHQRHGTVDWRVFRRMAAGSIPATLATLIWMDRMHVAQTRQGLIVHALGAVLLLAAAAMLFRGRIRSVALRLGSRGTAVVAAVQPALTILGGAVLGTLVALTSVGAGALGTAMLVYLYPHRLSASRLAGTDVAHAVPLAVVAGTGHLMLGNVNWMLLASLLLGSIPGVIAGAFVSGRAPEAMMRTAMMLLLLIVSVPLITY